METNIQTLENCKTVVTLKAGKEEWAGKIEKAYNKLETKVSLPGFRKGKAPKEMVRSKIKLEDVFNEALNYFLNDNYSKVLKDNNLRPIVQPTIDVKKISLEEVECDITVVGEPKVELKEYKGITVEKSPVAVTESEINEELTRLQERNAEVVVKEEGSVVSGDIATIDFEGFVDGVAFEGGKGDDYDLTIGSNTFIPGFEDQIIGMNVNETKDVNVTFPENYVEALKGKPAVFKVTVKAIKTKVLPEINDDLALDANLDNVETLEQLKEHYKNELKARKELESSNAAYNKLLDIIIEGSTYEIAHELVEEEVHSNIHNLEHRLSAQGVTLDNYLGMLNMKYEDLHEKLEKDCLKNLKYMFTLFEIAKKEGIKVEETDLNSAYEDMAAQYNMSVEDVKKALANRIDALANDILTKKVNDFLKKENNI